ncbi:unnamed protein product [Blumeria hordei]|uniref:C2H2-type domain-containing protein n=1 Tax=Blumeria hordei TaxID=2867405 RepID=A0A383UPL3_BLUHO|nr:unnamed protein product [Blumeria hordei]
MTPHYMPVQTYSNVPITTLVAHHTHQPSMQHQNPFTYAHYTAGNSNNMVTPFANTYVQTRPGIPYPMQIDNSLVRTIPFCRPQRQGFIIEEPSSQGSTIKSEPAWNSPPGPSNYLLTGNKLTTTSGASTSDVNFGTEVDTLMKAIQAKSTTQPQPSVAQQTTSVVGASPISNQIVETCHPGNPIYNKLTPTCMQTDMNNTKTSKKRYQCTIEGCTKSFYQKTHLDIHERAHTGVKPYLCKQPGCDRTFSQLGNLKTHERRHTGERPYQCDTCGKRFAQRGNVRAHKIVHDQSKPYICKLDDCGKQFTQLGNLKSHQNKFHIATIRALTAKFASIQEGDTVHAADRELWVYFANLYKNSNKGIKGRGKDRKVGSNPITSSIRNNTINSSGYGMNGPGRGNMVVNLNVNLSTHHIPRNTPSNYELYEVEDDNRSAGGASSSTITSFEDAHSDGYDEPGRPVEMPYGERIY